MNFVFEALISQIYSDIIETSDSVDCSELVFKTKPGIPVDFNENKRRSDFIQKWVMEEGNKKNSKRSEAE